MMRPDPPLDMRALLFTPAFQPIAPMLFAHAAGLIVCAVALIRIGGPWSWLLAAASLVSPVLRGFVLVRIRALPDPAALRELQRWTKADRLAGLAWCAVIAGLCLLCALEGDQTDRSIAICMIFGTTADIAARATATTDLALAQIAVMTAPSLGFAWSAGSDWWLVMIIAGGYFLALRSIVHRHGAAGRAMIDAERTAREAVIALSEREAELRNLFDNATTGILVRDASANRFVRVNPAFCKMLGRTEAEVLSEYPLGSHTHLDDQVTQELQWAGIRKTGEAFRCERRYIRSDGGTVWGLVGVAVSAREPDGRPRRYVATVEHVTERKAAEAALEASQKWLRLSMEIGGVWTFQRDYLTGLIYCDAEMRRMSGLPVGDEPVAAAVWEATVLPEDLPRFRRDAAAAHAERRSIVTFTYRFLHPEKGVRYAETRSRVDYDDEGRAIASVGVFIDVTDRRHTENRLAHLAQHDPLTDLPNRSLFRICLDEALERARATDRFAILFLDLDHFKEVNDTLGHAAGDALLLAVTRRLGAVCGPTDIVARLGGDEFAIIQHQITQPSDAAALAERIISALSKPFQIEGDRVIIGSSVGVVVAPDDGADPDHLLRNADTALYSAKEAGRGCHRFFDLAMLRATQERRALENDLRQALASDALELHYQPLMDVATRRIRGFEALLRWPHPERGLIMPDAFIPLAESKGLIVPIGAFVLRKACMQATLWPDHVRIAVNLSAAEFGSPKIVETVADALQVSKLAPHRLELEITETTMLQDGKPTMETLLKLKGLGVSISIDDFGIGFSALSYLQRFRFDKVKIDRSFVTPLGTSQETLAIVSAIVNLCAALKMDVTAEGVETEAQFAILSGLGCTEAQGYLFSRPRPPAEIDALIAQYSVGAGGPGTLRVDTAPHSHAA